MDLSIPGVTVFTAPKPFRDPHIALIQHNAIGSWMSLGKGVEVLLIGDEPGIEQTARDLGARHIAHVERNENGTPLISSIFERAEEAASYPHLAYANADIILLDDFLPSVGLVVERFARFLIVGQRWDLDVEGRLDFGPNWCQGVRAWLVKEGRIHPPAGSDYFVFPRGLFGRLPPFALGRSGWDNWMIYCGRRLQVPVIDAGNAITVVHQSHDYSHLEAGTPHYGLPESAENVRLGGGRATIFTLSDSTWRLSDGGVKKIRMPGGSVGRWAEAGAIARLGPGRWLSVVRALFHPWEFVRGRGGVVLRTVKGLIGLGERASG